MKYEIEKNGRTGCGCPAQSLSNGRLLSERRKSHYSPTEDIAQKLQESLSFEYPLNQLPEEAANRLYKLEGDLIEEQSVYVGNRRCIGG